MIIHGRCGACGSFILLLLFRFVIESESERVREMWNEIIDWERALNAPIEPGSGRCMYIYVREMNGAVWLESAGGNLKRMGSVEVAGLLIVWRVTGVKLIS